MNNFILNKSLPVPNEVVLKSETDDRRQVIRKDNANNIIYLGTKFNFIKNVSQIISQTALDSLFAKFLEATEKGLSMQQGEGLFVKHQINLNFFYSHIYIVSNYLNTHKSLYKKVNFNIYDVANKT